MKYILFTTTLFLFFSCEFPDLSTDEESEFEKSMREEKIEENETDAVFIPFHKQFGIYGSPEKNEWILHINHHRVRNRKLLESESYWSHVLAVGKNKRALIVESDGEYFDEYGGIHPCTFIMEFKSNRWEVFVNAYEINALDVRRKQLNLDTVMMFNIENIKADYLNKGKLPPTWN